MDRSNGIEPLLDLIRARSSNRTAP
jgi:hypothetical protein